MTLKEAAALFLIYVHGGARPSAQILDNLTRANRVLVDANINPMDKVALRQEAR